MDLLLEGKQQSGGVEWRNSEGAFANVPLLPPRRYELDLSSQDGRSWAVQNLNMLAPFTNEIWKVLASVTDEDRGVQEKSTCGQLSCETRLFQVVGHEYVFCWKISMSGTGDYPGPV